MRPFFETYGILVPEMAGKHMKKYLEAGKIINTHGVKGEVKVEPWADSPQFLGQFDYLYIDGRQYALVSGRAQKGFFYAKLDGVDDVNAAMALKNRVVFIDRDEAELEDGAYFIQDIIGAAVVDEQGAELGKLTEVMDMPSGNIYVVNGEREILIPAVPEFVKNVDVGSMTVTVHLIEGM